MLSAISDKYNKSRSKRSADDETQKISRGFTNSKGEKEKEYPEYDGRDFSTTDVHLDDKCKQMIELYRKSRGKNDTMEINETEEERQKRIQNELDLIKNTADQLGVKMNEALTMVQDDIPNDIVQDVKKALPKYVLNLMRKQKEKKQQPPLEEKKKKEEKKEDERTKVVEEMTKDPPMKDFETSNNNDIELEIDGDSYINTKADKVITFNSLEDAKEELKDTLEDMVVVMQMKNKDKMKSGLSVIGKYVEEGEGEFKNLVNTDLDAFIKLLNNIGSHKISDVLLPNKIKDDRRELIMRNLLKKGRERSNDNYLYVKKTSRDPRKPSMPTLLDKKIDGFDQAIRFVELLDGESNNLTISDLVYLLNVALNYVVFHGAHLLEIARGVFSSRGEVRDDTDSDPIPIRVELPMGAMHLSFLNLDSVARYLDLDVRREVFDDDEFNRFVKSLRKVQLPLQDKNGDWVLSYKYFNSAVKEDVLNVDDFIDDEDDENNSRQTSEQKKIKKDKMKSTNSTDTSAEIIKREMVESRLQNIFSDNSDHAELIYQMLFGEITNNQEDMLKSLNFINPKQFIDSTEGMAQKEYELFFTLVVRNLLVASLAEDDSFDILLQDKNLRDEELYEKISNESKLATMIVSISQFINTAFSIRYDIIGDALKSLLPSIDNNDIFGSEPEFDYSPLAQKSFTKQINEFDPSSDITNETYYGSYGLVSTDIFNNQSPLNIKYSQRVSWMNSNLYDWYDKETIPGKNKVSKPKNYFEHDRDMVEFDEKTNSWIMKKDVKQGSVIGSYPYVDIFTNNLQLMLYNHYIHGRSTRSYSFIQTGIIEAFNYYRTGKMIKGVDKIQFSSDRGRDEDIKSTLAQVFDVFTPVKVGDIKNMYNTFGFSKGQSIQLFAVVDPRSWTNFISHGFTLDYISKNSPSIVKGFYESDFYKNSANTFYLSVNEAFQFPKSFLQESDLLLKQDLTKRPEEHILKIDSFDSNYLGTILSNHVIKKQEPIRIEQVNIDFLDNSPYTIFYIGKKSSKTITFRSFSYGYFTDTQSIKLIKDIMSNLDMFTKDQKIKIASTIYTLMTYYNRNEEAQTYNEIFKKVAGYDADKSGQEELYERIFGVEEAEEEGEGGEKMKTDKGLVVRLYSQCVDIIMLTKTFSIQNKLSMLIFIGKNTSSSSRKKTIHEIAESVVKSIEKGEKSYNFTSKDKTAIKSAWKIYAKEFFKKQEYITVMDASNKDKTLNAVGIEIIMKLVNLLKKPVFKNIEEDIKPLKTQLQMYLNRITNSSSATTHSVNKTSTKTAKTKDDVVDEIGKSILEKFKLIDATNAELEKKVFDQYKDTNDKLFLDKLFGMGLIRSYIFDEKDDDTRKKIINDVNTLLSTHNASTFKLYGDKTNVSLVRYLTKTTMFKELDSLDELNDMTKEIVKKRSQTKYDYYMYFTGISMRVNVYHLLLKMIYYNYKQLKEKKKEKKADKIEKKVYKILHEIMKNVEIAKIISDGSNETRHLTYGIKRMTTELKDDNTNFLKRDIFKLTSIEESGQLMYNVLDKYNKIIQEIQSAFLDKYASIKKKFKEKTTFKDTVKSPPPSIKKRKRKDEIPDLIEDVTLPTPKIPTKPSSPSTPSKTTTTMNDINKYNDILYPQYDSANITLAKFNRYIQDSFGVIFDETIVNRIKSILDDTLKNIKNEKIFKELIEIGADGDQGQWVDDLDEYPTTYLKEIYPLTNLLGATYFVTGNESYPTMDFKMRLVIIATVIKYIHKIINTILKDGKLFGIDSSSNDENVIPSLVDEYKQSVVNTFNDPGQSKILMIYDDLLKGKSSLIEYGLEDAYKMYFEIWIAFAYFKQRLGLAIKKKRQKTQAKITEHLFEYGQDEKYDVLMKEFEQANGFFQFLKRKFKYSKPKGASKQEFNAYLDALDMEKKIRKQYKGKADKLRLNIDDKERLDSNLKIIDDFEKKYYYKNTQNINLQNTLVTDSKSNLYQLKDQTLDMSTLEQIAKNNNQKLNDKIPFQHPDSYASANMLPSTLTEVSLRHTSKPKSSSKHVDFFSDEQMEETDPSFKKTDAKYGNHHHHKKAHMKKSKIEMTYGGKQEVPQVLKSPPPLVDIDRFESTSNKMQKSKSAIPPPLIDVNDLVSPSPRFRYTKSQKPGLVPIDDADFDDDDEEDYNFSNTSTSMEKNPLMDVVETKYKLKKEITDEFDVLCSFQEMKEFMGGYDDNIQDQEMKLQKLFGECSSKQIDIHQLFSDSQGIMTFIRKKFGGGKVEKKDIENAISKKKRVVEEVDKLLRIIPTIQETQMDTMFQRTADEVKNILTLQKLDNRGIMSMIEVQNLIMQTLISFRLASSDKISDKTKQVLWTDYARQSLSLTIKLRDRVELIKQQLGFNVFSTTVQKKKNLMNEIDDIVNEFVTQDRTQLIDSIKDKLGGRKPSKNDLTLIYGNKMAKMLLDKYNETKRKLKNKRKDIMKIEGKNIPSDEVEFIQMVVDARRDFNKDIFTDLFNEIDKEYSNKLTKLDDIISDEFFGPITPYRPDEEQVEEQKNFQDTFSKHDVGLRKIMFTSGASKFDKKDSDVQKIASLSQSHLSKIAKFDQVKLSNIPNNSSPISLFSPSSSLNLDKRKNTMKNMSSYFDLMSTGFANDWENYPKLSVDEKTTVNTLLSHFSKL